MVTLCVQDFILIEVQVGLNFGLHYNSTNWLSQLSGILPFSMLNLSEILFCRQILSGQSKGP